MSTSVFAQEATGNELATGQLINEESNYITAAVVNETLPDGIIVKKEIAFLPQKARALDDQTLSGRVVHTYYTPDGLTLVANITAYATFTTSKTDNTCTLDSYRYTVNEFAGTVFGIYDEMDSWVSNQGMGIFSRYSEYTVKYKFNNLLGSYPNSPKLWIKCESDGDLTDSGNQTYSLTPNQVMVNDTVISFG